VIQDEKLRDLLWWGAVVVGILLLACLAFCVQGCKTCPPRVPCPESPPKIITVEVPAPCVIQVAPLAALELQPYPPFPGEDATDEQRKAWALALGQAIESGDAICIARDGAWTAKVLEHNALEPLCREP
jgi:hypothetical protein